MHHFLRCSCWHFEYASGELPRFLLYLSADLMILESHEMFVFRVDEICFWISVVLSHARSCFLSPQQDFFGDKDNEELRDTVTCSSWRVSQYY